MEPGRLRQKDGFTIAEVMIAFIILAIGFTSMLYLSLFAIKANMEGQRLGSARFIAEQRAENLRSLDYRHPMLIDDGDSLDLDDTVTPDFQDSLSRDGIDYDIMWNIAENIPENGIKTIKIFVLWNEQQGPKEFEFTTFKGSASR
ncbi:MAG: prepilin-type N-terminal cleavage/methylation domain-containing protein [Candidatus Zixiibacteriota bacterium]